MRTYPLHILNDGCGEISKGISFSRDSRVLNPDLPVIVPAHGVDARGIQALIQHTGNNIVSGKLHAAVGLVDIKTFLGAEKSMENHARPDRINACKATGIADGMRVALGQTLAFGPTQPRIHAGVGFEAA